MRKAKLKIVKKGKLKDQYVFILKADNGKTIATSEAYTRKKNALKVLAKYFPDFKIEE